MTSENKSLGSRNLGDLCLLKGEVREAIVRKNVLVIRTGQKISKQDGVEMAFLSGSDFSDTEEEEVVMATTNGK